MYNELFSIGPFTVHGYGLCIAIGLLACLFLACKRAKKVGLSEDICYGILYSGVILGFIGAKILYIFVEWDEFYSDPVSFISSSGFVVYGGLLFGMLGGFLYCTKKKVSFVSYLDLVVPSIALAQGFGRIGCFMAGCCYGRPTDSFIGITFHNSLYAPNNRALIPTQLLSAAGDFIIMGILLVLDKKVKKKGVLAGIYMVLYSIGRFVIEFFRNDPRGTIFGLSTSQFFGIIALIIGIVVIIAGNKANIARPSLDNPEEAKETKEDSEASDKDEVKEETAEVTDETLDASESSDAETAESSATEETKEEA